MYLSYHILNSVSTGSSFKKLNIELYTDRKAPETEKKVEETLKKYQIFYNKSEIWIESEKLYEILYEMEV